ncbi:hypothetical protein BKA69DRAFT_38464 [Paraphysoderma sedebokerense]|nr:hypothetical protein BKA69DRAFT_38464 [Paraphysoderma sedebokerense]
MLSVQSTTSNGQDPEVLKTIKSINQLHQQIYASIESVQKLVSEQQKLLDIYKKPQDFQSNENSDTSDDVPRSKPILKRLPHKFVATYNEFLETARLLKRESNSVEMESNKFLSKLNRIGDTRESRLPSVVEEALGLRLGQLERLINENLEIKGLTKNENSKEHVQRIERILRKIESFMKDILMSRNLYDNPTRPSSSAIPIGSSDLHSRNDIPDTVTVVVEYTDPEQLQRIAQLRCEIAMEEVMHQAQILTDNLYKGN